MLSSRIDPASLTCLALATALIAPQVGCSKGAGEGTAAAATEADGKSDKDKDSDGKEKKETAVPVEVVELEKGGIESVLRFSTNLIAESEVKIYAQAARLVREILVEEGDLVSENQVLLRLQDDEQRSALAKVQSQYAKALREHERLQRLFARQLISEQAFSDSTYEYEQLAIALEDAEREVGYTEVRAPLAGTITQRVVNVGDQVSIGQHLFDLIDFDSLVAPVFVPEKELPRLAPKQAAPIAPQAIGGDGNPGEIRRIAPIVDPQTGTVKVTVAIDDRTGLRPGMYVDVTLLTSVHEDALLVPKRALVYDKDQVFVYRLKKDDDRRVERVPVVPVLSDKDNIEPASGFAAGDQIVIAGQAGLKDGALVRLPGDPEPEEASDSEDDGEA